MTETLSCPACTAASPDGGLCAVCTGSLQSDLLTIGRDWADLADAVGGGLRLGSGGRRSSADVGVTFNPKAARLARDIAAALLGWSLSDVWDGTVPQLAATLARHPRPMRRDARAAREFAALAERLERTLDRPPPRIALGECGQPRILDDGKVVACGHVIRPVRGDTTIECPVCGWHHDVKHLLARRETEARTQLATAAEIAHFATWPRPGDDGQVTAMPYSVEQLTKRICRMVDRGRLLIGGHTAEGRPRYRIGTALDLLAESEARKARKASA